LCLGRTIVAQGVVVTGVLPHRHCGCPDTGVLNVFHKRQLLYSLQREAVGGKYRNSVEPFRRRMKLHSCCDHLIDIQGIDRQIGGVDADPKKFSPFNSPDRKKLFGP